MRKILYHLRRHVFQRPAEGVPLLIIFDLCAPSKVAKFDNIAILNQYILRLNIPMYKPLLMHVINPCAYLYEKVKRSILIEKLLFAY